MQEILDKLINEIKKDQRYLDYLEAEKKLHTKDIEELLRDYQNKLDQYEEIRKYEPYIDNTQIKEEIKDLKRQISCNEDIIDYYQKYHRLNDFLEEITKIVFGNISKELDLSPYKL
ncbi:YlbF family regulator [Thomasclavelia saccharogumia]|uniref:YlbF family regulator n=1 Tax=Thomasclavelia saccharogumia TaxID=341225 RepID=UPI00047A1FBC|nr:YlbF family regulator [Thomasclavelia saccharogumia]